MKVLWNRLLSEPAFLGGVLVAAVSLGTAFGLAWDGEQVATVTGIIGVLTGAGVRSVVSPAGKPSADPAAGVYDAPDPDDSY